jgi:hypothetical protein
VTGQYVGAIFLKRDGSNAMKGNIDMIKHRLVNLGDPVAQHDAVNLKFLDRLVKHDGSSQTTGRLNMGGYSITKCSPVLAGDLVLKSYADNVVGSTHLDMRP